MLFLNNKPIDFYKYAKSKFQALKYFMIEPIYPREIIHLIQK